MDPEFNIYDLTNNMTVDQFMINKFCEVIEVSISVYELSDSHNKLYLFKQKPNFMLDSEQSLVDKLIQDNNLGIGLYSWS